MPHSSAKTVFTDIGGVLLTNGWDTHAREAAIAAFSLEAPEFEARHEMLKTAFETGRLSLDAYVKKTVFYKSRAFSPEDFKAFMFGRSQVLGETLDFFRALAAQKKHRLFTLNNEALELHEYRVRTFKLDQTFSAFFCSCYLGLAKPDEGIYLNALGIAGCSKNAAVFVDDRALNVEPAEALGLAAVQFQGLDALRPALKEYGIEA